MAVAKPAAVRAADSRKPEWIVEEGKLVNILLDKNTCLRSLEVLACDSSGLYVKANEVLAPYTETAFIPFSSIQAVGVVAARA